MIESCSTIFPVNSEKFPPCLSAPRVNESTGEVSQECPWLPMSTAETSAATIRDNSQPKKNNEKEFGTGSLVYEDKELNDLLVMLDASQSKK